MADNEEVQSPCIGVCVVDESNGFCQGCFRTIQEIQNWWDLDNRQKKLIVDEAQQRESAVFGQ
jgi:uncharacterized protein